MKGPGGTQGGLGLFTLGMLLSAAALYFFFDSVRLETGMGFFGGMMRGGRGGGGAGGGGMMDTTSMGLLFIPLLLGLIFLFYNHKLKVGWVLFYVGIALLVIEIMSGMRPRFSMKTSHLLILFVTFAAGVGLMLRSNKAMGFQSEGDDIPKKKTAPGE